MSVSIHPSCSATVTDKFTGADLTEICQRACKFAIRESIEKAYERAKAREAAGAEAMQEEEEFDVSTSIDPVHASSLLFLKHCCSRSNLTLFSLFLHILLAASLALQPVPEVTARHFEVAMREARRSVSDADLAKYSSFAATLSQQRAAIGGPGGLQNFRFPRGQTIGGEAGGPGGQQAAQGPAGGAGAGAADEEDLYA